MLGAEGGWSQLAGTKLQQPPSLPGVSWFSRHAEGYGDVPTCPLFPGDTNQAAWGQQVGIRAVSLLCHCGGTPLLPGGTHHQKLLLLSSSPRFGGCHHLRPCPQPRRGHPWGPAEQAHSDGSASSATMIKSECCFPASSPLGKKNLRLEGAEERRAVFVAPGRACKQRELFPTAPVPGKSAQLSAAAPFPCPPRPLVPPSRGWAPLCLHPGDLHRVGGLETPQPGYGEAVGEGPAPGPLWGHPKGLRGGGMEVLGQLSRVPVAAGSAASDSRVADVALAPCASSPRVPESPQPRGRLSPCVTAPRAPSPSCLPQYGASGQQHPEEATAGQIPQNTQPGATFGDPAVPSSAPRYGHPPGVLCPRWKICPQSFPEGSSAWGRGELIWGQG